MHFCFNQAIRFANILSEVASSKISLFALCVESLFNEKVKVLVTQPTSSNPMDYSPSGLLYPWNSSGKNTGVGSHPLLQGILLTQGSGEPVSPGPPVLAGRFFTTKPPGKPLEQK